MTILPITLHSESPAPATGCGHCHEAMALPPCQHDPIERCLHPVTSGPPETVQHLMAALRQRLAEHPQGIQGGLIQSLHVGEGEVELTLALPRKCGGALLADSAFQTLRSLLPDTDIFVRHAEA